MEKQTNKGDYKVLICNPSATFVVKKPIRSVMASAKKRAVISLTKKLSVEHVINASLLPN